MFIPRNTDGRQNYKSKKGEKLFRRFFSEVRILQYDRVAAEESSNIAAKLSAIGRTVNDLDILIVLNAGIAIANGAEKIATNDRYFLHISKVSDLEVISCEKLTEKLTQNR